MFTYLNNPNVSLFEILVPAYCSMVQDYDDPVTDYIMTDLHNQWDAYVNGICGGLTILKTQKGQWFHQERGIINETMIPVRIACTAEQLDQVLTFTLEHYQQEEVMAYKVSDQVVFAKN